MNLDDLLQPAEAAAIIEKHLPQHPHGWEPGVSWDGTGGTVATGPLEAPPTTWNGLLERWNLDPKEVEVVEPVQRRSWEAVTKTGEIVTLNYFRAQIRRKTHKLDVDELVKRIERIGRKGQHKPAPTGNLAYVVAVGDPQLGKPDGDGTPGTVDRFLAKTDAAKQRLKTLRRLGHRIGPVYLPWLGDCIEGFNAQGGRNVWRTDLTLTEQIRLYRRLLLHQVETFAPLTDRLVVPVVPGNHDEAVRIGDKLATRYDDSFAIEGASAVADALKQNPAAYGHVHIVVPERDELTITLDIAGTIVGLAHGHQTRNKTMRWWADQAHGRQPIGDATVLLTGHYHHLKVEQSGAKTWIQTPALDGGSTWWRHNTGQEAPPGIVTLTIGPAGWQHLEVL